MRIRTNGKFAWRTDLYDHVKRLLGETSRVGAVDGSCEFTREMLGNLEEAADHPDMTEELAEVLSTSKVQVEYEVQSGVNIDGRDRD